MWRLYGSRDAPLAVAEDRAEQLNFLYENQGNGGVIQLLPGIAYCFREFHALISDLVQGAWVRYVRRQNLTLIGETTDLHEFLFGSERNNLVTVRPVLLDLQHGRCFYCNRGVVGETTQVDHFVAWARYPADLGGQLRAGGYPGVRG